MAVVGEQSVLFGVPADAFKAVKQHCMDHNLPFPRTLVAPQEMLINATPQFNPEFFLYDFLFVYGAAFRPDLMHERLILVLDEAQQFANPVRCDVAAGVAHADPVRSELNRP